MLRWDFFRPLSEDPATRTKWFNSPEIDRDERLPDMTGNVPIGPDSVKKSWEVTVQAVFPSRKCPDNVPICPSLTLLVFWNFAGTVIGPSPQSMVLYSCGDEVNPLLWGSRDHAFDPRQLYRTMLKFTE